MDVFKWLLLNADHITAFALLFTFVVMGIVALQKQWVVPGWVFTACITDRDKFEARVEALAKSNEDKIRVLESEVAILREQPKRRAT